MNVAETRTILDELADRAVLVDAERDGETTYTLPPPMAGLFEFSMMRMRGDVDQKLLGELFYQYMNVEEEFITSLFVRGETQIGRVFVHEPVLSSAGAVESPRACGSTRRGAEAAAGEAGTCQQTDEVTIP